MDEDIYKIEENFCSAYSAEDQISEFSTNYQGRGPGENIKISVENHGRLETGLNQG